MSFTPTVKHIPPYMAQREILARSSSNSSEPIWRLMYGNVRSAVYVASQAQLFS